MFHVQPLSGIADAAVERLLDRAFGANRHGRTAYRLRAGTRPLPALCFAAIDGAGTLAGTIQCWPVRLDADGGEHHPMVLVGPVAVAPERQGTGIGRALMAHSLAALGEAAAMLIGDPEYYARFGFDAERTGGWRLPGPFEPRRLLACGPHVPAVAGIVVPDPGRPDPLPAAPRRA